MRTSLDLDEVDEHAVLVCVELADVEVEGTETSESEGEATVEESELVAELWVGFVDERGGPWLDDGRASSDDN